MIPHVRDWKIKLLDTNEVVKTISAPNRALARICFRMDYPQYWGRPIRVYRDTRIKRTINAMRHVVYLRGIKP